MLHMQNPYLSAAGANGGFDWSDEISVQEGTRPGGQPAAGPQATGQAGMPSGERLPGQNGTSGGRTPGWNGPISGGQFPGRPGAESLPFPPNGGSVPAPGPQDEVLDLRHNMTEEQIEAPISVDEARAGSMKAMLSQNVGYFVVATFLVGTQNTTSWEGILYEVGNDFIVIYQFARNRYIVCDIYSLKYVEFYDTRQQARWENLTLNLGTGQQQGG